MLTLKFDKKEKEDKQTEAEYDNSEAQDFSIFIDCTCYICGEYILLFSYVNKYKGILIKSDFWFNNLKIYS